jgi:hypothetical protein
MMTIPIVCAAAVVASTAAFWVFRPEMSGRTIGFFFLAQHPMIVPLTAMLFGAALALASYGLALALLALVSQSALPLAIGALPYTLAGIVMSAAAGTLLVGLSAELGTLIPVYLISMPLSIALAEKRSPTVMIGTLVAIALLLLPCPFVWRRRCAA